MKKAIKAQKQELEATASALMPKQLNNMQANLPAQQLPTIQKVKSHEVEEENPLQALHKSISAIDKDIETSRKKVKKAKKLKTKKEKVDWQEMEDDGEKNLAEDQDDQMNEEEFEDEINNANGV